MRSKPFTELNLNERRAYLKAAEAFFRPRLNERLANTSKKVANKQDLKPIKQ